jgi:hypothetical protein
MSNITGTLSTEKGVSAFIKRNPLISMYVIMFSLAWSVMIPQSLYSQGVLSEPIPELFEILTGWSPIIASILVTAMVAGRVGVRELLRRFLIWRVGFRWYFVGVFLLAFIILGGIGSVLATVALHFSSLEHQFILVSMAYVTSRGC